jgi:trigger factor
MKADFRDVTSTRKNLVVEIPSHVVDAEIDRITRDYSRAARIPGFRPGKVPPRLVLQRFREQILHDVAHGLIPKAVDDALKTNGVEPVDVPDISHVFVEEGRPLRFTATFETVPPIDPGAYDAISLRRHRVEVNDDAVEQALKRLCDQSARYEPVEGRGIEMGDTVLVDLKRRPAAAAGAARDGAKAETHENVTVEVGSPANPPGFDDELAGLLPGASKRFEVRYPADYTVRDLASTSVAYEVEVRAIKRRVVPDLDDEFAKEAGPFESLAELRDRVESNLQREAAEAADRQLRADLVRQLAERAPFEVPSSLVEKELDRRIEDFVHRLIDQRIDPNRANIDWTEFRERQRESATEAVRGALVLDEVARREGLQPTAADVDGEVGRYAERTGRNPAAVRASLEKSGGLARLEAGLRRERTIDFLLDRATIASA